jgi:hypothetical protein
VPPLSPHRRPQAPQALPTPLPPTRPLRASCFRRTEGGSATSGVFFSAHILTQPPDRVLPSSCPYSPECVEGVFSKLPCKRFSEVRQESFKDHTFGVASLLALLLHWVQPPPTGALGKEYKRCTSYRSNIESALSKWHRLVWRSTYESNCIHKIRITRAS